MPNFIQIRQKTQKLKILTFGRFWLVGQVGQKMVIGILNSFYVVFAPSLAPIPNFIQIGPKMKIFVKEVNEKEVNDVNEVKIMFSAKRYVCVPILNHLGR